MLGRGDGGGRVGVGGADVGVPVGGGGVPVGWAGAGAGFGAKRPHEIKARATKCMAITLDRFLLNMVDAPFII
jgi:hypothetical protein